MTNKKIYKILSDFEIYDYYSHRNNSIQKLAVDNCPIIFFPDNTPCFEANSYIIDLLLKGHSQINGGTLKTYATNISFIIKFCYENKILKISDLTNDDFIEFINNLKNEKNERGKYNRKPNQIINIGQRCIDFLLFIQELYDLKSFIGIGSKFQIRLIKKNAKQGYYKNNKGFHYSHSSFPYNISVLKKQPISKENSIKLRKYLASKNNDELRSRDLCIFDCFEITGARRDEIRSLKIQDVIDALQSNELYPSLRLITLKTKRPNDFRLVPVPRTLLNSLSLYIRRYRKKIIQNTIGLANDHGYIFISHSTGKPLSVDTFTTYMHQWAISAKIDCRVNIHQFRHKFITEKILYLIKEFQIENKYKFREAFLDIEKLKLIIQQWTGHKTIQSLNTYIDYAFLKENNVDKLIEKLLTSKSYTSITDKVKSLETSYLNEEITKDIFLEMLNNIVVEHSNQINSSNDQ